MQTLEDIYARLLAEHEENICAANPWGCNGTAHNCPNMKGTSREPKVKNTPRLFRVNSDATVHEQINQLASAIEKASQDGARLEAVIKRPEFGELILECGNSSPTHPSRKDAKGHGAHGVKHAFEARHNISGQEIAQAVILGKIEKDKNHESRLKIQHGDYVVVLEREIAKNTGRISSTKVKLHTAMRKSA